MKRDSLTKLQCRSGPGGAELLLHIIPRSAGICFSYANQNENT